MLYTVKYEGKKYAYDSASGAVLPINTLEFKMLNAMVPPITPASLTSLRYELAKFDSNDVSEAFEKIYKLVEKNILYAKDDSTVRLIASGEYACPNDALASVLLEKAFAEKDTLFFETIGDGDFRKTAIEIAMRMGKKL